MKGAEREPVGFPRGHVGVPYMEHSPFRLNYKDTCKKVWFNKRNQKKIGESCDFFCMKRCNNPNGWFIVVSFIHQGYVTCTKRAFDSRL